jgi:hypothetical protein
MNHARFITTRLLSLLSPLAILACAAQAPAPEEATGTTSEALLCSVKNPQPGCAPGGGTTKCGVTGGACCPAEGGTCLSTDATCSGGKCIECGLPGDLACPGTGCLSGSDVNGVCLACSATTNANVSAVANGPTQATVAFTSSSSFATAVSLVNTGNLADKHEAFGPAATSSSVPVSGLSPSTTYFVVLTPEGCGLLPQTSTANATLDGDRLSLAMLVSGFNTSTLTLKTTSSGPEAVFNASGTLATFAPGLATSPPAFALPSTTLSPPSPLPTYTATFTALNAAMSAATVSFELNQIELIAPFTATIHLHTDGATPDADLSIDAGTLDVVLGFSPLTQAFFVKTVTTDLQDHITNCGLAGWCDGIFNDLLPNLDAPFATAIQGALGPAISGASATTAVEGIFAQVNTSFSSPATPPESVVPGSLAYTTIGGDNEFIFNVQWISNSITTVTTTAH